MCWKIFYKKESKVSKLLNEKLVWLGQNHMDDDDDSFTTYTSFTDHANNNDSLFNETSLIINRAASHPGFQRANERAVHPVRSDDRERWVLQNVESS